MAEYLLTPEEYKSFADESQVLIDTLTTIFNQNSETEILVQSCINRLNAFLAIAEKEQKNIWSKFQVHSDEELQMLFQNFYQKSGLTAWTGINLEQNFLQAYRIMVDKNLREMQQYIDTVLLPAIIQEVTTEELEVTEQTVGDLLNKNLKDLYIQFDLGSGKVTRTRSLKPVNISDATTKGIKILADKLTRVQRKRINELKNYAKTHGNPKVVGKTVINGNNVIMSIQSDWYEFTKHGMTASEAKKLSPAERTNINNSIIDSITQYLDGKYQSIARTYIKTQVLSKDDTAFFVGSNTNKITGILGEIGAIIAIGELLPGVDISKIMNWTANHRVGGKELSIDIVLKDLANVQVKNSNQDLNIPEIRIDFASMQTGTMLQRLQTAYPQYNFEDLENIFVSESFNIPAKKKGNKWTEVSINTEYKRGSFAAWETFKDGYNKMQDIISDVKTLLTAFAPDFLYLSGGPEFTSQLAILDQSLSTSTTQITGNNLYIIRNTPYTSYSILTKIKNDLEQLEKIQQEALHFQLHSSLGTVGKGENKVSYNYVWYRNNNKTTLNRKSVTTASMLFD